MLTLRKVPPTVTHSRFAFLGSAPMQVFQPLDLTWPSAGGPHVCGPYVGGATEGQGQEAAPPGTPRFSYPIHTWGAEPTRMHSMPSRSPSFSILFEGNRGKRGRETGTATNSRIRCDICWIHKHFHVRWVLADEKREFGHVPVSPGFRDPETRPSPLLPAVAARRPEAGVCIAAGAPRGRYPAATSVLRYAVRVGCVPRARAEDATRSDTLTDPGPCPLMRERTRCRQEKNSHRRSRSRSDSGG